VHPAFTGLSCTKVSDFKSNIFQKTSKSTDPTKENSLPKNKSQAVLYAIPIIAGIRPINKNGTNNPILYAEVFIGIVQQQLGVKDFERKPKVIIRKGTFPNIFHVIPCKSSCTTTPQIKIGIKL
jgi:hypothetical protein